MKIGYQITENVGAFLHDVPDLSYTYVRQELQRFAGRFKMHLAETRMQGPPGINWFGAKTLKNSKHFKYGVEGDSFSDLAMVSKISGILMMHETGGTIRAKGDGWLYIIDRKAKWGSKLPKRWTATGWKGGGKWSATQTAETGIVARVKSVTLKPRLQFRKTFDSMVPDEKVRLKNTVARALKVARERNFDMKEVLMNTRL